MWTSLIRRFILLIPAALFAGLAAPVHADGTSECVAAAQLASAETGVPLAVLVAITQTETGRGDAARPWPWTVNLAGEGHYFETPDAADSFARQAFAAGKRSFDIGCFQINYRWHGDAFASITAMFDPATNARYAARLLKSLYTETGDWSRAAGAYHSRTPQYATRYRARFDGFHAAANGDSAGVLASMQVPDSVTSAPRTNSFVLLQPRGTPGGLGSLVPNFSGS
jgi:hypothetical protein